MNPNQPEYSVQPAYNETFLPQCPPSYSDALASSFTVSQNAGQFPYHKQPQFVPNAVTTAPPPIQIQQIQPQVTILPISVGPNRTNLRCPHCNTQVLTEISKGVQKSAHYTCFILFILGCCLCSCIPYCLASFKNVNHRCPACKGHIGTYRS